MASSASAMEALISVYTQRLQSSALQRLSIADILSDAPAFSALQQAIPSRETLRISKLQERNYNRLIRFINLHEPTGHERDEEHKRNAVRYLGLRSMLHECSTVKTPNILEACVDKMLQWFDATESESTMISSMSTPSLSTKMSPKRTSIHSSSVGTEEKGLFKDDTTTQCSSPAELVKHFKQPDLRGSHIRRIAELRSRGQGEDSSATNSRNSQLNQNADVNPTKQLDRSRVDATFHMYRPETDVEIEMNLRWLQHRNEEEIVAKKERELQDRVHKWGIDRSRDESEYLRKHESSRLASKLEQIVQRRDCSENSEMLGASEYSGQCESSKAPFFSKPTSTASQPHSESQSISKSNQYVSESSPAARVIIKSKAVQATPSKGGMHFRNQLPANFTPTRSVVTSVSATQIGESKTPTTQHLRSTISGGDSNHGYSLQPGNPQLSGGSDCGAESETGEKGRPGGTSAFKFQSFYESRLVQSRTAEMSRSEELLGTVPLSHEPADPEYRHLHFARAMRQTVALATQDHQDSGELHESKSLLGSADHAHRPVIIKASPASSRQQPRSSARSSSARKGSKPSSARSKTKTSRSKSPKPRPSTTGRVRSTPRVTLIQEESTSMSDLRREQLDELEKIRRLFEEKQLPFPARALERGLLVPEDRPVLQSIHNLPLPGSRLVANPLPLASKLKAARVKKKTRKGKKKPKRTARL